MAEVSLQIGDRTYRLGCRDGEEDALLAAAALLDGHACNLQKTYGHTSEARLLLMSALQLSSELIDSRRQVAQAQAETAEAMRIATFEAAKVAAATTQVPAAVVPNATPEAVLESQADTQDTDLASETVQNVEHVDAAASPEAYNFTAFAEASVTAEPTPDADAPQTPTQQLQPEQTEAVADAVSSPETHQGADTAADTDAIVGEETAIPGFEADVAGENLAQTAETASESPNLITMDLLALEALVLRAEKLAQRLEEAAIGS